MKALLSAALFCLAAAYAQTAPAAPSLSDMPENTVVAVFEDGVKFTIKEFRALVAILPPQMQQTAMRDRKSFLQQYGLMRKLSQLAMKDKLDQQSPTREALEYNRMYVLTNAKLADAMNSSTVEQGEVLKAYDSNKERYRQVQVKAIYIAFGDRSDASGKKVLTEEEAKAKAEKLLAQIRSGADFVKLVKENSDDETSAKKDGDFGILRRNDNMPDAIRNAVFNLKEGETSEPIRQSGGFYLLRAQAVGYRALSEVRDEIFGELKQAHYKQWLDDTNRNVKVEFPSETFLNAPATPAPK